jgi:hypothetical protein
MKKYLFIFLILIFTMQNCYALSTKDLKEPKKPAYRLGLMYEIEKEYRVTNLTETQAERTAAYEKEYIKNSTYADSSLKDLSN